MASVARKVTPEVLGWGVLVMLIVIISLVLIRFKTSGTGCPTGYVYNSTADACGLLTNQSVTVTPEYFTTVDTSVTALQEPVNWIEIVIIAVIGAAIVFLFFMLFGKKLKGSM